MNNFFVDISQIHNGGSVEILGSDVNHIGQVLRMKSGEQIIVRDGYGYEYLCEITKISQEQVLAKILEMREIAAELPSEVWLFQSLPKGDKMELIVQKAVELGVSKIVPVASQRCVVKLDKKRESSKIKRWNFIAESAAKQSGRGVIPEVLPVARFSQALSIAEELDIKLMPYECADELLKERNKTPMQQTKEILSSIQKKASIGVFIGPEGGFEKAEVDAAMAIGVKPLTLGKRILRTETAGLCILSVLMFHLEE